MLAASGCGFNNGNTGNNIRCTIAPICWKPLAIQRAVNQLPIFGGF